MKINWIFDIGFRYDEEGRAPGWIGPMASLMICVMAGIVFLQFRIAPGWPVTLLAAFETLATQAFVRRRLHRVWKRRYRGILRGATWIEIAAICWVLWASAFCYSGVARLRAAQLLRWQQDLLQISDLTCQYLPRCALACSVAGIGLGLFQRRPFRGPAMHIVAFFLWSCVIIFGGMALVPANAPWAIPVAEVIAIIGIATLIAAGVLALKQRKTSDPPGPNRDQ